MKLKEIRKNARKNLKRNYFKSVLVCFVVTFVLTGGVSYVSKNPLDVNITPENAVRVIEFSKSRTNSETIQEIADSLIEEQEKQNEVFEKANNGFASTFFNILSSGQSMIFNMINGAIQGIQGNVSAAIIAILVSVLWFIFRNGFLAAAEVGRARYFLEQRRYLDTAPDRTLYPYRKKRAFHVSLILFIKNVKLALWSLTIIGYFVKFHEYAMIPYILAENPNIKVKEAFKLSKELTYGDKGRLFCLSLELIAWHFLGLITFNLSNILFVNPYEFNLFAESYIALRKQKRANLTHKDLLNDRRLVVEEVHEGDYPEKKAEQAKLVKQGAKKKYALTTYIMLFFIFGFVGWAYEVALYLIGEGRFVNRGTMYGPWLPIYGTGGVAILFFLQKFRKKPLMMFISSFILCGIVEYFGGWFLYTFAHARYWDYTGYFLNINGFICLESLTIFGLGGCGFTYIAGPFLDDLLSKMNKKLRYIVCAVLVSAFAIDFICCQIYGNNSGDGIGGEITQTQE